MSNFIPICVATKSGRSFPEWISSSMVVAYFQSTKDVKFIELNENLNSSNIWRFYYQNFDNNTNILQDNSFYIINNVHVIFFRQNMTENNSLHLRIASKSGMPIPVKVTTQDIFEYFDSSYDISLENSSHNLPTATHWKFRIHSIDGEVIDDFLKDSDHKILNIYFVARVIVDQESLYPPIVVITLFSEKDNSFYAVSAEQKDKFLSGFRLQYEAESELIFHREDGKFECSPDVIGQLKLDLELDGEVSVLTIKRVRYICRGEYFPNRNGHFNNDQINQKFDLPIVPSQTVHTPVEPFLMTDNDKVLPPGVPPTPVSTQSSTTILEESHSKIADSSFSSTATASSIKVLTETETETGSSFSNNNRSSFPEVINTKSLANFNAKIEVLPNCAERSLLGLCRYFAFENDSDIPHDQIEGLLVALRNQIEEEQINNYQISRSLQALGSNLKTWNRDQIAKLLLQCLNDFQVVDSDLLIDLLQKTLRAAANIENKEIILLLGNTGAGKSTTIHFLGGSTFCLEEVDDGYRHLKVVSSLPQLLSFITSSNPNSETFNINAIDLEYENTRFTLCDTPGFKDNRGVEVDIANGIGVATAVRGCRSVRPLVLISSRTLGERLDGIAEILKTPIDFISSIEQHLSSLSYCFTKFNLSEYKGNTRLFKQINSKLKAMKESGNASDTVVTVFQDLLNKIEVQGGVANVLDPEHDSREEFIRNLLATEPIRNPSAVFQDFANPESLNLLKMQLSKHKTSVEASLERQNYALLNYKLNQLKIFSDCLQITDCKIFYDDSVKKVSTHTETLLTSVFEKLERSLPDANNYIESDLRECAFCIRQLYALDDIRAQHFPRLTSFHSTCLTRILRFQKDLTSCLFSQKFDFMNKETMYYFKNNEMKIRIEKLRLLCCTFTDVFASHKHITSSTTESVDSDELLAELPREYQIVCDVIRSNLHSIISTFHDSLASGFFDKSLHLLDIVKILLHIFESPVKDISDDFLNPECYNTMRKSLEKILNDCFFKMKELIEKTTCLLLSTEQLSDIEGFICIIAILKNHETAMSHFERFSMTHFDDFLNTLKVRILDTKQMITQIFTENDDAPFTVIHTYLLPIAKLREIPLIYDFTIEAYSNVTDELDRLLSTLSLEISSIMEWLQKEMWDIHFSSFETKLRKLSDAKLLVDLPGMVHHDYFQQLMTKLEDFFMVFSEHHCATPISYHKPRLLNTYMQSYIFFQSCSRLCKIPSISERSSFCSLVIKINEQFQCSLDCELQRIRNSLPIPDEIIQIDHFGDSGNDDLSLPVNNASQMELCSLPWGNTHFLWLLKALQIGEAESVIVEFASAYFAYYNRISVNLTVLFGEIVKEDSVIILPESFELRKKMVTELHRYLLVMREFSNHFRQLLASDNSDEYITLQGTSIDFQQLHQFRHSVFSTGLRRFFDCWLQADDANIIINHLLEYLEFSDFTDYDTLQRKYTISSLLCPVDHFMFNSSGVVVKGSYAMVKDTFFNHLKELRDSVSIYIRNEDYEKVREIFTAREPASQFIEELTSSVGKKMESLIQKTDKMKITISTLKVIEPTIKELHSLQKASELILEFLKEPVRTGLDRILTIQFKILSALYIFFSGVDEAIERCDFVGVENILQSVLWVLQSMFGSIENFNAFKDSNNMPSYPPIDVTEKYSKMEDYLKLIVKAYEESFRDVCSHFKLDASQEGASEVLVIPTGEGMTMREFEASSGSEAQVVSLQAHRGGKEVAEDDPLVKLRVLYFILQSVLWVLCRMFGSIENFNAFKDSNNMPSNPPIDVTVKYSKMEDYLKLIVKAFDECFRDVCSYFKLDASQEGASEVLVIPTGEGMTMKEFEASSGSEAQVVSLQAHRGGKEVAEDDPLDKLRGLLSTAVPKEISERLLLAAAQGQSAFYSKLEKKFLDFLKTSLLDLLAKCERKDIPSDTKRKILSFLRQHHIVLPTAIVVEISEKESIQIANLEAEQENLRIFIEENEKANNLSKLIEEFCRYFHARQYEYSMNIKLRISSMIQKTVVRLSENLKAGHFSSVIKTLGSTWDDWEHYQNYCVALSQDQYFRRIAYNPENLRDYPCYHAIMKFICNIIEIIRKFHSAAHSVAVGNPKVFTVLTDLSENIEALLEIRNTTAYKSLNTYCQPDRLDNLIEEIILRFPTAFVHYSNAIEGCLQAEEFPISELAKLLDIYQHSHNLQSKLNQYSSGILASKALSVGNVSSNYKSYDHLKNHVVTDAYVQQRSSFKQDLLHHPELSTPNSIERDQYYKRLYRIYQNLSRSEVICSHVNAKVIDLSTAEADCNSFLKSEINCIGNYLMNDLIGKVFRMRTVEVYGQFGIWYDNLRSFKEAFQGSSSLSQSAAGRITEVDNYFAENLNILVNTAMGEKDDRNLIKKLLPLKEMSVHVPFKKKVVDIKIDYILNNITSSEGSQRVINIGLLLNSKGQDPMAQMIIADHKVFEGILVLLFSTRVSRFTIEQALDKKDGIRGTDINIVKLRSQCELFDCEYQSLVSSGLSRVREAMKKCVSESKIIAVNKKLSDVDRTRKLMVQLFSYWTLSHSEHYQQMVESSDNSSSSSGSGSKNGGIDADKRVYLMQPHVGQILAIFRIFGIDGENGGRVKVVHHFAQINTGEGKSVVLAIVSTIFALMGFSVDCACYSEYLSRRDYLAFSTLFTDFGVYEYIVYGTFTELCERFLNQRAGDIRETVQNLILKPTVEVRSSRDLVRMQREKVLVIDEVDVFLNKHFFGNVYRPFAKLVDPTITALINKIWDSRNTIGLTLRKVSTFPEYTSFIAKFSQWQTLMEDSVKTMLGDLKNADSHEPILLGDQIGYKDQDKISFDISYGYKTMFAYYKANTERKISPASLQSKIYLLIDCGAFSFAEIPKLYKYILGVSGTLETLSTPEKELLCSVYNITKFTYVPSVYGGRKLEFFPDNGKDIKIESNNNFFNEITNEINYRRESSTTKLMRPILVYFENSTILMNYYHSVSPALRSRLKIVKIDVTAEDKESIIRQATALGSITLLTQEFGRGVDFVVFDDRIDSLGGVHVIQTFMSDEESVQVQIKGRAGRQGCRGSYSMILSEGGLEKFMEEGDVREMRSLGRYIETLERKRKFFFEDKYQGTLNFINEIKKDHNLGMDFLAALTSTPMATRNVKSFIHDRNKSYIVESSFISRTLILMDTTGSMYSLITKTKETVKRMFSEALAVLAKQNMKSTFEVQFAGYRNYNAPEAQLLEHSYWESNPDNLFTFIDSIETSYGFGNEAIEIGLWYADSEIRKTTTDAYRYQIILIGDQPPNTESEVVSKRKGRGEQYWSGTKFHEIVYYQSELDKLKANSIPVHAFYVKENAKLSFQQIAMETGGESSCLDINSPAGADMLTGLVTERILNEAAGGGAAGSEIINEYRKMFPKGYVRDTNPKILEAVTMATESSR